MARLASCRRRRQEENRKDREITITHYSYSSTAFALLLLLLPLVNEERTQPSSSSSCFATYTQQRHLLLLLRSKLCVRQKREHKCGWMPLCARQPPPKPVCLCVILFNDDIGPIRGEALPSYRPTDRGRSFVMYARGNADNSVGAVPRLMPPTPPPPRALYTTHLSRSSRSYLQNSVYGGGNRAIKEALFSPQCCWLPVW